MNGLKFLKRIWQALPLSDNTRWRVTSILLEPALPLIKNGVIHNAYLREKEWRLKRISPFHGDPFPSLPPQIKTDIYLWGVIDWRLRYQRPQHLACGLAAQGYRVFYISTQFVNDRKPGFELEQLDESGRLFNVRLHLKGRPPVYAAPPVNDHYRRIQESIATLLQWSASQSIISIVQYPYWYDLARKIPNSRLVYDCLDHHDGFGNAGSEITKLESSLFQNSELVVTTSKALYDIAVTKNPRAEILRNATEFDFFSKAPASVYRDTKSRKIIGYYGAIAHWTDVELLQKIALAVPDCLLLMVGSDECGARQKLAKLPNVLFTGEVPYTELPYYLYAMDVCLLPFKVIPLTLATNPVKVYEYLSAGKAVVSIDLPELAEFGNLVATANSHEEFVQKLKNALQHDPSIDTVAARKAFASRHTWSHRVQVLAKLIEELPRPKVSVIVVTFNNLALTKKCLHSLQQFSNYDNLEIIVVDNNSSDGTPEYLRQWREDYTDRHIITNADNRGFAAANNQGLAIAQGDYLVLLNNDTEVTPGWIRTLLNHLRFDSTIGMIGPVTNNIGNEARIKLKYANSEEMQVKAKQYTLRHMGVAMPIQTLAFFCVMMRRHVYETVGDLDESYGLGFFEDDDYCRRVQRAGWKLVCAEDVFIHHHLSASFGKNSALRQELIARNRKIYESKWGPWTPHKYR